jgi:hypothetical protein
VSRPRRLAPILVAFAAVAVALFVAFEREPGRERTAAPRDSTPPSADTTAPHRDLAADERRGGHTLERHVGLDEEALRARLAREPSLTVASSFFDRATAERAIGALIARESDEIDRWQAGRRDRLALSTRFADEAVGMSLRRGAREPDPVRGVRAVLVRDSAGWYVLTAYPSGER